MPSASRGVNEQRIMKPWMNEHVDNALLLPRSKRGSQNAYELLEAVQRLFVPCSTVPMGHDNSLVSYCLATTA